MYSECDKKNKIHFICLKISTEKNYFIFKSNRFKVTPINLLFWIEVMYAIARVHVTLLCVMQCIDVVKVFLVSLDRQITGNSPAIVLIDLNCAVLFDRNVNLMYFLAQPILFDHSILQHRHRFHTSQIEFPQHFMNGIKPNMDKI